MKFQWLVALPPETAEASDLVLTVDLDGARPCAGTLAADELENGIPSRQGLARRLRGRSDGRGRHTLASSGTTLDRPKKNPHFSSEEEMGIWGLRAKERLRNQQIPFSGIEG